MTAKNAKGRSGLKRTPVDVSSNSLSLIRADVMSHLNAGHAVDCPCCGQLVKKYQYRVTSVMARQLRNLFIHDSLEYVDFENSIDGGKQHKGHYLAKWNLIEFGEDNRYRVTPKGIAFIEGKITISKHIEMYNQNLVRFSGPQVTFAECLGKRFDLDEVLSAGASA